MRKTTVQRHMRKTKRGRTVVRKHPRKLKNRAAYAPIKRYFPEDEDKFGMLDKVNLSLYKREKVREGVRQKRAVWLDTLSKQPKEKPFVAPEEKEIEPEVETSSKRKWDRSSPTPIPKPKSPPPPPPPVPQPVKAEKVKPNKFKFEAPIFTEIEKEVKPIVQDMPFGVMSKENQSKHDKLLHQRRQVTEQWKKEQDVQKKADLALEVVSINDRLRELRGKPQQSESSAPPKFNQKFAKEEPKTIRREVPLRMETPEEYEKKQKAKVK